MEGAEADSNVPKSSSLTNNFTSHANSSSNNFNDTSYSNKTSHVCNNSYFDNDKQNQHSSCNDFDDTSYSKDVSHVDNNACFENDKDTLPPPSKFKRSHISQRIRKRRKLKAATLEAKERNRLEQHLNSKCNAIRQTFQTIADK